MSAFNRGWKLFAVLGLSVGFMAGGALAAGPAGHEHGAGVAKLSLDEGRKWPTDAPLRQAMGNIRNAMEAALRDIHAGRLSAAGYDALAGKVNDEVAYVVANCKLEPRADAQLHLVVAGLLEGAEAMTGKAKGAARRAGAEKVVAALGDYGRFFDDSGWKPIRH